MKRVIYCFFALIFCLAVTCGCQKTPPNRQAALDAPFSAEIQGEMRGVEFAAKIEGEGREGELSITYLTPDPLSELCVRAHLRTDGSLDENAEICRGDMTAELSLASVEGLLLPLSILFSHAQIYADTVQKSEGGYQFVFADGTRLSVSEEGIPQALTSTEISYQIVWWER